MNYTVSLSLWEVMDRFSAAKTRAEKILILQQNDSNALRNLLVGALDDRITFLLPNTPPPYKPAAAQDVPTNLIKQIDNLKYFAKGGAGDSMSAIKRETIFIRMLEAIHPNDAKLLLAMIAKKPLAKGLTKLVVKEAFPGLLGV